ncbi:MAG: MFS transporter [Dehalococcoidia bacterium]|jgi:sugar phosphate permease|nr:MFS transporter [Dehalococcoidia bacterium]
MTPEADALSERPGGSKAGARGPLSRLPVSRLAWIVWGVALLAQLLNSFHRVSAAVAVDRLMLEFDLSAAAAGSLLAVYFYTYAAMQIPSGILADYFGPRRVLTTGCLVAGAGSILFGLASSVTALYAGRFLLSFGVSVVFVSVLKIQANWFPSHYFGRISSLMGFVGGAGSLIGATPMALLVAYAGWRGSYELLGAIGFLVAGCCWLVVRDRPAVVAVAADTAGASRNTLPVAKRDGGAAMGLSARLGTMVCNRYVWPPLLIGIGAYGTLLVFQGAWGVPYLMQVYGLSRDAAATFTLLLTLGYMFGMVGLAALSEKYRTRKKPAVVSAFVYAGLWLLVLLWNAGKPPLDALYAICLLLGLSSGFTISTLACVKEVVPRAISGMSMGLVNIGPFITAAVLQVVFGLVLDRYWGGVVVDGVRVYGPEAFRAAIATIFVGSLAYVVGALTLKETHCRDLCADDSGT